ncbi:hypothetical protein BJ875DRAFT_547435 [Amylocarpus encephaloides]|uniref:Uncharacterized protein n=1 Tax=Amylocarpus encephaloides TaxID=45428 RepID=A0A9P7Y819_9HELO|nr:hypothetical protein BJ875DRAFT_547435 [Amylocarpus encephaloides]
MEEIRVRQDYPLSLDQRVERAKCFKQAKGQLEAKLKAIRSYFNSPHAPAHNGPPSCDRCNTRHRRLAEAIHDFYQEHQPYLDDEYFRDLEMALNNPRGPQLSDMHDAYQKQVHKLLKADLCAPEPMDDPLLVEHKQSIAQKFDSSMETQSIIDEYIAGQRSALSNPSAVNLINALQVVTTPEQRAQAYIDYYCRAQPKDLPQQKNFKAKYVRLFEQLTPHDTVVSAMRAEADDVQANKVFDLRQQLGEMQMAFSAHLKNKAKRAEKDRRMNDRGVSPRLVSCTLEDCPIDINVLMEETIQCAICEWLDHKGVSRGRFHYCSVEHAEEDFDNHERQEHQCCMGTRCLYHPEIGPEGESRVDGTELCGICYDCENHEVVSYFCSEECYRTNLDFHRDEIHYGRNIPNMAQTLLLYSPAADMEIVDHPKPPI